MRDRYLEITFRKGKPLAAYLYLSRASGVQSLRTEPRCQALELLDTVLAVIQPPRRTGFGVFPDAPAPGFYSYDAGGSIVRCIAA